MLGFCGWVGGEGMGGGGWDFPFPFQVTEGRLWERHRADRRVVYIFAVYPRKVSVQLAMDLGHFPDCQL